MQRFAHFYFCRVTLYEFTRLHDKVWRWIKRSTDLHLPSVNDPYIDPSFKDLTPFEYIYSRKSNIVYRALCEVDTTARKIDVLYRASRNKIFRHEVSFIHTLTSLQKCAPMHIYGSYIHRKNSNQLQSGYNRYLNRSI